MEHNANRLARDTVAPDTTGAAWGSPDGPAPDPAALPRHLSAVPPDSSARRLEFDPVALRARTDGWTREKQRLFIEELADCGIVREAAARVGMTEQSAHRLRRRANAAAFNLSWEAALQLGTDRLRTIAWERAVLGTVKPHYYRGELIGEERVYDNRLLAALVGRTAPLPGNYCADIVGEWDGWMEAIEEDAEDPVTRSDMRVKTRIWQEDDGAWWTNFRSPPGFSGTESGEHGDEDYWRTCTAEECEAIAAKEARREREEHRRRDAWFAALK